jgi:hypothetical protein
MTDGFKATYQCKTDPSVTIQVKDLGAGEKKIRHADGTEEKISAGKLHKGYKFVSSTEKRFNSMSRTSRMRVNKTKKIV